MSKPILGLILGGILGVFDGLSALVSAPETAPDIVGIVIGSTFKGLVAGVIIGWFANKVHSVSKGVLFGLAVGAFFAFLIAAMPDPKTGLSIRLPTTTSFGYQNPLVLTKILSPVSLTPLSLTSVSLATSE